ncbi:hypothetical protein R3P38DRAFT_3200327 [Favolaschia claudopus]|uniref:Bacteriophage T5 Orf172 DNA-binding domain-containing protein n=1 Tax=Favolaschia claudopus TaxID=2862362 RepID=A0AAW0B013_9AGAR
MSSEDKINHELESLKEQSQYCGVSRVYRAADVKTLLNKPFSKSEEEGVLYLYREKTPGGKVQYKAGRTNDIVRRMEQWKTQCYKSDIELLETIKTLHSHRLETAVHLWFKVIGAWVVPYPCESCGIRHREKFEFGVNVDALGDKGVEKAIKIAEQLRDEIDGL